MTRRRHMEVILSIFIVFLVIGVVIVAIEESVSGTDRRGDLMREDKATLVGFIIALEENQNELLLRIGELEAVRDNGAPTTGVTVATPTPTPQPLTTPRSTEGISCVWQYWIVGDGRDCMANGKVYIDVVHAVGFDLILVNEAVIQYKSYLCVVFFKDDKVVDIRRPARQLIQESSLNGEYASYVVDAHSQAESYDIQIGFAPNIGFSGSGLDIPRCGKQQPQ